MRVLYIGHYRDGTGWGNAALNNILALDAAGVEVVPRAITYEASDKPYPDRIKRLEAQSRDGCDVVIQHTLPSNYWYDRSYKKNIGITTCETSHFKSSGWQYNCNLMDEIWVSSEITKKQVVDSDVTKPVKVAPYSLDLSKYKEPLGEKIDVLQNNFTFGFVGEFIERKNIKALVQAFHLAFDPREPVNLFIKTSKRDLEDVQNYFKHVRNGLRIRQNYKEEVVVCGMMEEKDYISVLNQVNCFVIPSRGEACCIPSLEAMAMGIPSIYTMDIGVDHLFDLSKINICDPVRSYPQPCFGAMETLPHLDTAESFWREIDVDGLVRAMRYMYSHLSKEENKKYSAEKCIEHAQNYSHKAAGEKMKEILNDR